MKEFVDIVFVADFYPRCHRFSICAAVIDSRCGAEVLYGSRGEVTEDDRDPRPRAV